MKAKFILADSGGTSTKWCIVMSEHEHVNVETRSLHPRNIVDRASVIDELKSMFMDFDVPVYFYGAGCASELNKGILMSIFTDAGFKEVTIESDILGICKALLGDNAGYAAILGTGSILVHYDGKQITQRLGGFGPIIGDEGSGLNFGKILVRYALEMDTWSKELEVLFESKDKIYAQLAQQDVFSWLGSLAHRMQSPHMDFLHEKNIEAFIQAYLHLIPTSEKIHIGGSYGYYKQTLLAHQFKTAGYDIGTCVQNPLEKLAHYHLINKK